MEAEPLRITGWLMALMLPALPAFAQDWGTLAVISSTLGNNAGRLCLGEGTRNTDIGCPAYAPYVDPATGNVGVGTDHPASALEVSGDLVVTGNSGVSPALVVDSSNSLVGINGAVKGFALSVYAPTGYPLFLQSALYSKMILGPLNTDGSWNPLTRKGDSAIIFQGSGGTQTGAFSLVPWSTKVSGLRMLASGYVGLGIVTPTVGLEVSGTVSATHFVGDGSGLTGVLAGSGDRLVSGSAFVQATQDTGGEVSGTFKLTSTGTETCDTTRYYSLRVDPATGVLQMCRP
jgi:hypothetical protein